MAEDQLRTVIDGIRTRLQAELEAHLGSVAASHDRAIEEARREAEAAAEQRWASQIEVVRAEWSARLESQVTSVRSEVERTMVAESMRARVEAEQAAAEAASIARREMEQTVAAERQRADAELETERGRAEAQMQHERQRAQEQIQQAHARAERAEARAAQVQAELEQAHAEIERTRAQNAAAQAQSERAQAEADRAQAQRDEDRRQAERNLAEARAAFEAERTRPAPPIDHSSSAPASSGAPAGLLASLRAIDEAASLSDALAAALRGGAAAAPRAALFLVHGTELHEWPVAGVTPVDSGPVRAESREAGMLGEVLRRGEAVSTASGGPAAPTFAALPPGRTAIAVPFVLGGQPVAVLYADEGATGQAKPSWQETVQILGRHAAASVGYLTAVRIVQATRMVSAGANGAGASHDTGRDSDDEQAARRYARLLVSEIKLYNESAVRMGRERRDLLLRLRPEIERARRLYDERVGSSVSGRDAYFQQELAQTLADGDHSLLG